MRKALKKYTFQVIGREHRIVNIALSAKNAINKAATDYGCKTSELKLIKGTTII